MKIYIFTGLTVIGLLLSGIGSDCALADLTDLQSTGDTKTEANVSAGYRGVSQNDETSRVLEYDSLKSSPLFNVDLATDREIGRASCGERVFVGV